MDVFDGRFGFGLGACEEVDSLGVVFREAENGFFSESSVSWRIISLVLRSMLVKVPPVMTKILLLRSGILVSGSNCNDFPRSP